MSKNIFVCGADQGVDQDVDQDVDQKLVDRTGDNDGVAFFNLIHDRGHPSAEKMPPQFSNFPHCINSNPHHGSAW